MALKIGDFIEQIRSGDLSNPMGVLIALFQEPLRESDFGIIEQLIQYEQEFDERNLPYCSDSVEHIPDFFAGICVQTARLVIAVDRQGFYGEDVAPLVAKLNESRQSFDALKAGSSLWEDYCSRWPRRIDLADLPDTEEFVRKIENEHGIKIQFLNQQVHEYLLSLDENPPHETAIDDTAWVMSAEVRLNSIDDHLKILDRIRDRVSLEHAAGETDYETALYCLTQILPGWPPGSSGDARLDSLLNRTLHFDRAPWPLGEWSERAVQWCEELKRSPHNVNWGNVLQACESIREYGDENFTAYTHRLAGFAEAQLSPSQLKSLYDFREDSRAVRRLRRYFFSNTLWKSIPEEAQNALIIADRAWMERERESMLFTILNHIQRATERILYAHLWRPLIRCVEERRFSDEEAAGFLSIKSALREQFPGLADYKQALWTKAAKSYFTRLGIADKSDDMRFLIHESRTPKHLQNLMDARNKAEHNPNPAVGPERIRALYAQFLGIKRQGVLPELLRLLTAAPRDAS